MHPFSQATIDFALTVGANDPESPQPQLHDAQVPDVLHAFASDPTFGLGAIPAIMVNDLGQSQADADAMAAKIAAVQSSAQALKESIDALNASLDG